MEKRENRSGRCLRTEPEGLDLTLKDEGVARAFKQAGCWRFCEKLKGGHTEVTKAFALNFSGLNSKVALLEFPVSPQVISAVTEIPRSGQEWFKNYKFDTTPCKEFLKEQYVNQDLSKAIPRHYIKEHYALLLTAIQKYLTCEGRYTKVYSYHFKLLLHFTGKTSIDIPFYLFRSLGKMCDKVQYKKDNYETSLFHHGLIKLLVLDSLNKIGRDWESFIFMSGFQSKTGLTPLPDREKEGKTQESIMVEEPILETIVEEPTVAEPKQQARDRKKQKHKSKQSGKPVVIKETPKPSEEKMKYQKVASKPSEIAQQTKIRTRSQLNKEKGKSIAIEDSPMSKGSLKDLLEAIDFEQATSVQVEPVPIDLTQSSPDSSKKSKASKRLRFEEAGKEFMVKPRRPITRGQAQAAEQIPKGEETAKVITKQTKPLPKIEKPERVEKIEKAKKAEKAVKAEKVQETKRIIYTREQTKQKGKQVAQAKETKESRKKEVKEKTPLVKKEKTSSTKEKWEAADQEMANIEKTVSEIAAMESELAKLKAQLGKLAAK